MHSSNVPATRRSLRSSQRSRFSRVVASFAAFALIATTVTVGLVFAEPAQAGAVPVAKSIDQPARVLAGEDIHYTVSFTNETATPWYNLSATLLVPNGVEYTESTGLASPIVYPSGVDLPRGEFAVSAAVPAGFQLWVWEDIADLPASATYSGTVTVTPAQPAPAVGVEENSPVVFPVGAEVAVELNAFASEHARFLPIFDGSTGVNPAEAALVTTAEAPPAVGTTEISALRVTKEEPSPESELPRGVNQNSTVYTIKIENTTQGATDDTIVVDYLPAGLEFLGGGGTDNSAAPEYAGAGLHGTPVVEDYRNPETVETVEKTGASSSFPADLPNGVYTRVEWRLDLAAGDTETISYRAGIPLSENTMDWPDGPATPPSLMQGSNLDNNSGASTRHSIGSVEHTDARSYVNRSSAIGEYQGVVRDRVPGADDRTAEDQDDEVVDAIDLRVVKTVDSTPSDDPDEDATDTFQTGGVARYTLNLRTSEYTSASGVELFDVLNDGICPLVPVGTEVREGAFSIPQLQGDGTMGERTFDGAPEEEYPASCVPGAEIPDGDWTEPGVTGADIDWIAYDEGFGNFVIAFAVDSIAAQTETAVVYPALMRITYKDRGNTSAADRLRNTVVFTATTTTIDELGDPVAETIADDSAATLQSGPSRISKKILPHDVPFAAGTDPCAVGSDEYVDTIVGDFALGDQVCYELTVEFAEEADSRNPQIIDMLPVEVTTEGWDYEFLTDAPDSEVFVHRVLDEEDKDTGRLLITPRTHGAELDANGESEGDYFVARGAELIVHIWGTVNRLSSEPLMLDKPENLMKFTQTNVDQEVFFERSQADFELQAGLQLLKGVAQVTSAGGATRFAAAGPDADHVQVQETDEVAYRIDLSSGRLDLAGNQTGLPYAVSGLTVWDVLPDAFADAVVTTPVPDGGRVVLSSDTDRPADAPEGKTLIVWDDLDIPADQVRTLGYTLEVPRGTLIDSNHINTARIVQYDVHPNDGGAPLAYIPGENVSDMGTSDNSDVFLPPASVAKRLVGTEIGNGSGENDIDSHNSSTQAVPGELITYEYSVTIPANSTVAGGVLSDRGTLEPGDVSYEAVAASWTHPELDTEVEESDFGFDDVTGELTFPASYTNTTTNDQTFTVTLVVYLEDDLSNGVVLTNRADFTSGTWDGSDTATVTYIEPNLGLAKSASPSTAVRTSTEVEYTLTLSNNTNRPKSYDNVVVDTLPVGLTIVPGSITDGGVEATVAGVTTITWQVAEVSAAKDLKYKATIDPDTAGRQEYSNLAEITGFTLPGTLPDGPDAEDRRSERSDDAEALITAIGADIAKTVRLQGSGDPFAETIAAPIGDTVEYEVEVSLPADINFYDPTIEDDLPAGVELVDVTVPQEGTSTGTITGVWTQSIDDDTDTVTWAYDGDITANPVERTLVLSYRVKLTDAIPEGIGSLPNTATFAWNEIDGDDDSGSEVEDPATVMVDVLDPELVIDKEVKPAGAANTAFADSLQVDPDDEFDYRLRVTNTGNTPAYNLVVTDTVPNGVIVDGTQISPGGVFTPDSDPSDGGGSIAWDATVLPGSLHQQGSTTGVTEIMLGYSATLIESADIADADVFTNVARVTSYESFASDGRSYGPSAPAEADIEPAFPHLALEKAAIADPAIAYAGTPFGWTLTATNTGDGPAKAVTLTDTLPENWAYTDTSSVVVDDVMLADELFVFSNVDGVLSWEFTHTDGTPVLEPGKQIVVSFRATPSADARDDSPGLTDAAGTANPHRNTLTAQATDTTDETENEDGPYTEDDDTADAFIHSADLVITKEAAADPVVAGDGETLGWTITVENDGPNPSLGTITVDDVTGELPDGVTVTRVDGGEDWTCAAPTAGTDGATEFDCDYTGTLASGAALDPIRVYVTVAADFDPVDLPGGTVENSATVTTTGTFDPEDDNNDDNDELQIGTEADLGIVKTVATAVPDRNAGLPLSWTLAPSNLGPSVSYSIAADLITVTDEIPAGISGVVAAGGTDWDCNATIESPLDAGDTLSCSYTGTAMPVGSAGSITLSGLLLSSLVGDIENSAQIEPGPTADTTLPNNDDEVSVTLDTDTSLNIAKTRVVFEDDEWVPATESIVPGENVSYLVQVVNNGPADARVVTVVDELPTGLSYVSHQAVAGTWSRAGAATGDQTFTLTGTLPAAPGSNSASLVVTALIDPSVVGDVVNWAEAGAENSTNEPRDSSDSDSSRASNLSIVKSHTGDAVAGDSLDYTITVTNEGPSDSSGPITITDTLPTGFSYAEDTASVSIAGAAGAAQEPTVAGQVLSWTIGSDPEDFSLGADETIVITLTTDLADDLAAQDLVNTVAVDGPEDTDPTDDTGNDPTTVVTQAEMTIDKTVEAGPYLAGTPVEFTLTVTNNGPSVADAQVEDLLPTGLTLQSITSDDDWDCDLETASCDYEGHAVGSDAATTITVTALIGSTVLDESVLENLAELDWTDSRGAHEDDDSQSITVTAQADLGLVKTAIDAEGEEITAATAGQQARYLIQARNHGPSSAVAPISVEDTLPPGASYIGLADSTYWECTPGTVDPIAGQQVDCEFAGGTTGLAAGASAPELVLIVQLASTLPTDTIVNTATVDSPTDEPSPDVNQNSDDAELEVDQLVDLSIVKSHAAPVRIGDELAFDLLVHNDGPSAATGVTVVDTLPKGLEYVDVEGSDPAWTVVPGATALDGTTEITATLSGSVLPDTDAPELSLVVLVHPEAYSTVTNVAEVEANQSDSDTEDNSDEDEVVVPAQVDLEIVKSLVSPAVLVGQTAEYLITVTNHGPTEDPGTITVTDVLPDSLRAVAVDHEECALVEPEENTGGTVDCAVTGPLAVDESFTITVTVDVLAGAYPSVANTATVSTTAEDLDPLNDESTVTSPVTPDIRFTLEKQVEKVDGATVFWAVTVTSVGLNDAVDGVTVRDSLPSELSFVGAESADGFSCETTDQDVSCEHPDVLPTGDSATVVIETTTSQSPGQTVTNSVWLVDQDTDEIILPTLATADHSVPLPITGGGLSLALILLAIVGVLLGGGMMMTGRLRSRPRA